MPEKVKGLIKSFGFDLKSYDDEKRRIKGYVSTKDLDRVMDIVDPKAFEKSFPEFVQKNGVLLFNHSYNQVVGKVVSGVVDKNGLMVEAEIAKGVAKADEVWSLIKQGILKTFSFGFIPKSVEYKEEDNKEIRIIKDLDLLEVSIVAVPANPNATFVISEGKAVDIEFEGDNPFEMETPETKKPSGKTDLPLADKARSWDKNRAIASVRKWASSDGSGDKDKINWSKYRQAFFWYDENDPENFGSYKLPFAEVIDGKLYAVPRGIMAAAAAIQGARGGVNIPEKDVPGVKRRIAKYYKRMDMTPPWEKELEIEEIKSFILPDIKDLIQEEVKQILEEKVNKLYEQVEELKKEVEQYKKEAENKNTTDKLEEDEVIEKIQQELKEILTLIKD